MAAGVQHRDMANMVGIEGLTYADAGMRSSPLPHVIASSRPKADEARRGSMNTAPQPGIARRGSMNTAPLPALFLYVIEKVPPHPASFYASPQKDSKKCMACAVATRQ